MPRRRSESVFSACEKRAARLWIGVERSASAVANGVAVVLFVQKIIDRQAQTQTAQYMGQLKIGYRISWHANRKRVGLVVVVVLSAHVASYAVQTRSFEQLPGEPGVRGTSRNERNGIPRNVDSADSAVAKAGLRCRYIAKEGQARACAQGSIELHAFAARGRQINVREGRSEKVDFVIQVDKKGAGAHTQIADAVLEPDLVFPGGLRLQQRDDGIANESDARRAAELTVALVDGCDTEALANAAVDGRGPCQALA